MCNFMRIGVAIAVATTYYHEPKSCQLSSPSACLIVCAVRVDYCCLLVCRPPHGLVAVRRKAHVVRHSRVELLLVL